MEAKPSHGIYCNSTVFGNGLSSPFPTIVLIFLKGLIMWSWSHTTEAYRDAEFNLRQLPIEEIGIIWAEWKAASKDKYDCWDCNSFHQGRYAKALRDYRKGWHKDAKMNRKVSGRDDRLKYSTVEKALVEIWDKASELATCDNGGFNAWVCPFGCCCHTVKFDLD